MIVSGNGLKTIGSDAFAGCDSLTGVEVPDSVTEIGDSAFGDNANLTLWCSENGIAWQYAETNGIMAEERIRRAVSVEVAAPADKQQYGSSEKEIDTTGLTLNVTWMMAQVKKLHLAIMLILKKKQPKMRRLQYSMTLQKQPMKQESHRKKKTIQYITKMKREMIWQKHQQSVLCLEVPRRWMHRM